MACLTPEQIELLARDAVEPSEAEGLRQHIEQCDQCRRKLAEAQANEEALRKLKRLPDADLLGRTDTSPLPDGQAASEPAFAGPPPDSFAGYKIIKEIHRGGQGVVYQAIQKSTKRKVAIKAMKEGPFADKSDKARFEREVEILGQLNHPNIVGIHDTGTAAGCHYFVMDYISGQPLDVWMASGERSIDETLRLFTKVCDAVNAAHLRGVIHRDLKPGNVRIDPEGEPHVLDFGLAKVATGAAEASLVTLTGQFMGSLPWASPEQAEAIPSKIDIRTDVYSLGVILYEMLTDRFPYEVVGNMRDVLDRIMKAEPAKPSTIRRQINDEVETIVLKCLSKERERRYQSAGELARDIRHYLNGEPIEAKRDSALYVLGKTLRKYRATALAALAVVLSLLMGFVVSTKLYLEAESARAVAESKQEKLEHALALVQQKELETRLADEAAATAQQAELRQREIARREQTERLHHYARNLKEATEHLRRYDLEDCRKFLLLCPAELRGWEWHHLWTRLDSSVATFGSDDYWDGTEGYWGFTRVAFTPDGERILAFDDSGDVLYVWSASTFSLIAAYGDEHWAAPESNVHHDMLAFDATGLRIVGAFCLDPHLPFLRTSLALYDVPSGALLCKMVGHEDEITCAAFSPDGKWVASGGGRWLTMDETRDSGDTSIRVWNANTGQLIATLRGHTEVIKDLVFSPDSQRLASVSGDNTIRVWDISSQQPLQLFEAEGVGDHVVFDPSGKLVAARYNSESLGVWDAAGGALLHIYGHPGDIRPAKCIFHRPPVFARIAAPLWVGCVRFAQEGKNLAYTLEPRDPRTDPAIIICNVEAGKPLTLIGHVGDVNDVAFSPDGMRLVSGSEDGTVRLWDTRSSRAIRTLRLPGLSVWRVGFGVAGKTVYTLGHDGATRLWDADTLKPTAVSRADLPRPSAQTDHGFLAVAPTGATVLAEDEAAADPPHGVNVIDRASGEVLARLDGHEAEVTSADFSPDGTRIVTGSRDKTVRLWHADTGLQLLVLRDHADEVISVSFDPAGRRIASVSTNSELFVWDSYSPYHPDALPLVRRLFDQLILREDVTNRLQTDQSISEDLRGAALLIARTRRDDAGRLAEKAWPIPIARAQAETLWEVGDREGCIRLLRKALKHCRATLPEDHPDTAGILAGLGSAILHQEKYAEAEPLLRECLAIREQKLPDHWLRFNAMSLLGSALAGQHKFKEAEPLLRDSYAALQESAGPTEDIERRGFENRKREALQRIVKLYEAWNKLEQAAEWRAKLEASDLPARTVQKLDRTRRQGCERPEWRAKPVCAGRATLTARSARTRL